MVFPDYPVDDSKYSLSKMLVLAWNGISSFSVMRLRIISALGFLIFPQNMGVFEAGGLFALVISGVQFDQAVGIAYVLTVHIVSYLLVVLLGITLALREHVSLRSVKGYEC
jgi:uncharacterized membrane protein YbhN (UPF0104 family)